MTHRWSGWPGAWCLDCGAEDKREYCCAIHSENNPALGTVCERPECQNGPCPEPGSRRHDPYARNDHAWENPSESSPTEGIQPMAPVPDAKDPI